MPTSPEENRLIITEVFAQLARLVSALNPNAKIRVELDADTYNALSKAQGLICTGTSAAASTVSIICGVAVVPMSATERVT